MRSISLTHANATRSHPARDANGTEKETNMKYQHDGYTPGHGGYVSEFEAFMQGYLDTHPAVLFEQQRNWEDTWTLPLHPQLALRAERQNGYDGRKA